MNLKQANDYTRKLFSANWVKWVHKGTKPADTSAEKSVNVLIGTISKHCAMCLNLNGCYFVVGKCPEQPLHPNCHCYTIDIQSITAQAECLIEKFTEYIFVEGNSKKQLFESWGYSIIDSENLAREFTRQAKLKYQCGEYSLGNLDAYGQRISIIITLPKKNGTGEVSFVSGWMVYPNGEIVLTTPYGGK